jgi:uncharacterized membrane protein
LRAARLTTGATGTPPSAALALAVPVLLLALAVVGLGISSYLTYTHWAHASVACGGIGSCTEVNNSEYSKVASIPVALLGALSYLALIALALAWLWQRPSGPAWPVMFFWGLSLVGTLYSAYLTYIELFVLDAICIYCVASACIILASFLISTGWIIREVQTEEET